MLARLTPALRKTLSEYNFFFLFNKHCFTEYFLVNKLQISLPSPPLQSWTSLYQLLSPIMSQFSNTDLGKEKMVYTMGFYFWAKDKELSNASFFYFNTLGL